MAKVSIVLPVYNVEKYLTQCLDSIANQTFKDFECICVNDGSTDNSLKILQEYAQKDERFKIITQENKGLSGARNTGIKNTNTEYITFIDSDDWILNDYIEKLYTIAITYNNSDIVAAQHKIYFEKENKYETYLNAAKINNIKKDNLTLSTIFKIVDMSRNVWNKIYKTEFIKKINLCFFENVYSGEDYAFNILSFIYAKNFIFIDDFLYVYRKRDESLTANSGKIRIETFKSFIKVIEELVKRKFDDKELSSIYIKLISYHMGKLSKNVSKESKEELVNYSILSIQNFLNYHKNISKSEKIQLKIILFLLKTFKDKSFILFRILKNF